MGKIIEHHHDLSAIHRYAIDQLQRAMHQKRHPFREMVLATSGESGPDIRRVICRRVTAQPFEIEFHTDIRSAKVGQLQKTPAMALHFWHPEARFQLKLEAIATIHHGDEITERAWKQTPEPARAAYTTDWPPGAKKEPLLWTPESHSDMKSGKHFALVLGEVTQMEVLQLSKSGHIRASFGYAASGLTQATFLTP